VFILVVSKNGIEAAYTHYSLFFRWVWHWSHLLSPSFFVSYKGTMQSHLPKTRF